ncbi:50S ribosomal protein L3 [Candidatus Pacearchaeota archaeon]|nr:50S ribosomal protein L3 [Candidatus Pacearchaeota archaeon]
MTKHGTTRHGSLQFWPRSRAQRFLPDVSWNAINLKEPGLLGFIGYKVGMRSAFVKDNSQHSLTKGKRIIIPVTIIECPTMKILSVRFYKDGKVMGESMNQNVEKELKRKIKTPKKVSKKIEDFKDYDDIRVVVYSQVKKTGIKKTPDIKEIGLSGSLGDKLKFVQDNFHKEISIKEVFKDGIVDIRGVTKGKGLQGTVKRFGLTLKAHKSEKGVRTLGSGGPWHPSRVDYTQPRAGQMGFFTRVVYNSKIVLIGNIKEKNINPKEGFQNFGNINTDYIVLQGSVQGPQKRQLIITHALRPIKKILRRQYEFVELR